MYIDAEILVLALPLLIFPLWRAWKQTHSSLHLAFVLAFSFYLLNAIGLTLFPIVIDSDRPAIYQQHGVTIFTQANFIPFYFGGFGGYWPPLNTILTGVGLNILLTIPLGLLSPFVLPIRPRWLILAGGLGFELAQALISMLLGYPYRVLDANDVVSNALGVIFGLALFRLIARLYASLARRIPRLAQGYLFETLRLAA